MLLSLALKSAESQTQYFLHNFVLRDSKSPPPRPRSRSASHNMVATAVGADPATLQGLARSLTSSQRILLALTDPNNAIADDVTSRDATGGGLSLGSTLSRDSSCEGVDLEFRLYQPAGTILRRVELSGGTLNKVRSLNPVGLKVCRPWSKASRMY